MSEREVELYPIGSRVYLVATGEHGTVQSWGFLMGLFYRVRFDNGVTRVVPGKDLERAVPRHGWAAHAVVLEGRP